MSFDTLAPHYRWMEAILAGNKLQRCRTSFLDHAANAQSVLIVGEGNGRFLAECRRRLPSAYIACVDASAQMLTVARGRLRRLGLLTAHTEFIHADALSWVPSPGAFDLIVTHFFLDCFRLDQQAQIIGKLARATRPRAQWLLADFQVPATGLLRLRAQIIHRVLYAFFGAFTDLPARKLTPPDDALKAHGFELRERNVSEWGLLHADRWIRKLSAVG
jgi:ubiquinone/menaquinone biosynthesis C-methylase UbiE